MGVVRVPYLLAELKERGCADESALAQVMQPGCRIGEEDLRKLAANLGLEVSELAPAPENAANTRFTYRKLKNQSIPLSTPYAT
ncbi:hypothetical protein AOT24_04690 [Klebsiella pneumoniae]|nr:hypothetical protein AOT24_04690 [Klebsiella pneumoniae]